MITITKGRLLTIKQWRETYGPGSNVVLPAEEAEELARIALASLEADPVKRVNSDQMHRVCLEANRYLDKYDAMAKEVNKLLGRIAPPAPVFNGEYGDAYQGAREDLSIWKRRALEADEHVRRLEQINDHMVKEAQGESRMGEPVIREPAPVVPEEATPENVEMLSGYVSTYKLTDSERDIAAEIWNACRAAMLQSGNFRENKNSSTNNFREIAETSTNYPAIPSEVLSAILKVARIRADFDDFDGDRRGIGDCLDEAEQELIVTINKYASQLAAEPIATNDVREQTAVPPVPVTPDGWISCSDRMPEMGERQYYVLAADFKNNYPPSIPNTQVGVYGDWFNDGNPTWDDGDGEDLHLKEVTHWMPLPEPPKEVRQ
ncbi:DUF551 domain-containing protein [Escherichia coli]|nr:DUF551 domain-containing protein [Escherichia coli]ELT9672248.1 DUF551 domain-containing protein [Escherichia coli]HBH8760511.1 DUF551 domain-containing protein [Escherichia coli]